MQDLLKYFILTSIPFALTLLALYLLNAPAYYHVVIKIWVFCIALLGSYGLVMYLRK